MTVEAASMQMTYLPSATKRDYNARMKISGEHITASFDAGRIPAGASVLALNSLLLSLIRGCRVH